VSELCTYGTQAPDPPKSERARYEGSFRGRTPAVARNDLELELRRVHDARIDMSERRAMTRQAIRVGGEQASCATTSALEGVAVVLIPAGLGCVGPGIASPMGPTQLSPVPLAAHPTSRSFYESGAKPLDH
jgi:hypothetical protein